MRLRSRLNSQEAYKGRYPLFVILLLLIFALLVFRLAYLQLTKGDYYNLLSQDNYVQERTLPAIRGEILDRKGRLLAGDRPSYNVYVTPAFVANLEETVIKLEGALNLSPSETEYLEQVLKIGQRMTGYRQHLLRVDITREQVAILAAEKLELPGVEVLPAPGRYYPQKELTAHLTGYIGKINERELKQHEGYHRQDLIGKWGLEKKYEKWLRGKLGRERRVVDARGRAKGIKETKLILGEIDDISPESGYSLVTTIDLDMQKEAAKAFTDEAGAVVVMEVDTGRLLVYYSRPAYDPNLFVRGIGTTQWRRLNDSILHPLLDKVSQSSYYPGSTYKVVGSIAGLEEKEITPDTIAWCPGFKKVGDRRFHCWKRSGHGYVSLTAALKQSCDVYFYELAEKLGAEHLWAWGKKFGIGAKPGLDLNQETSGVLPDSEYHEKAHGRRWFDGDTMSHIIGQGDLKTSPLQLAVLYSAIAGKGKIYRPQIVLQQIDSKGNVLGTRSPQLLRTVEAADETWNIVMKGLDRVVNEPGGTAYRSRLEEPVFIGKTGTAQVARLPQNRRRHDNYLLKDHALFCAIAPLDNPKIAVAVVIEHGEHGSSAAAPVAAAVIKKWWELYHP